MQLSFIYGASKTLERVNHSPENVSLVVLTGFRETCSRDLHFEFIHITLLKLLLLC